MEMELMSPTVYPSMLTEGGIASKVAMICEQYLVAHPTLSGRA